MGLMRIGVPRTQFSSVRWQPSKALQRLDTPSNCGLNGSGVLETLDGPFRLFERTAEPKPATALQKRGDKAKEL